MNARSSHLALIQVGQVDQLDQFRIGQATMDMLLVRHLEPWRSQEKLGKNKEWEYGLFFL
jgi:hypothetical protein